MRERGGPGRLDARRAGVKKAASGQTARMGRPPMPDARSAATAPPALAEHRLTPAIKIVYSLGDHTVNIALTAMTLLYFRYLTDKIGFSGLLAGAVPWIGRMVDAFTDPAMGRISDHTRWRWGRRRPWILLGCVPFGLAFALQWVEVPGSDAQRFAYYATMYVLMSLGMTVVSVPYLALIPEMSRDYDERTSLNTYRAAFGLGGVFVTVGMGAAATRLGDDVGAWQLTAGVVGLWLVLPWLAVHRVTWERPVVRDGATPRLVEGLRLLWRHRTYQILCATYITGRIAIDAVSTLFIYYVSWVIGRPDDFAPLLAFFLATVVLSLPLWLLLARRFDKRRVFIVGCLWWMGMQLVLAAGQPDWERWLIYAVAALAGVGYAVVDFMPWAMLPDVIDEDELATGDRREGLYTGMFTFLRKIGGATAVLVIGAVLDLSGYDGTAAVQRASAVDAIRGMMAGVPAALLLASVWIARRYPLSREVHHRILEGLAARRAPG